VKEYFSSVENSLELCLSDLLTEECELYRIAEMMLFVFERESVLLPSLLCLMKHSSW